MSIRSLISQNARNARAGRSPKANILAMNVCSIELITVLTRQYTLRKRRMFKMKEKLVKNPCETCVKTDVCRHKATMQLYVNALTSLEVPDFVKEESGVEINCKFNKSSLPASVYRPVSPFCNCI